MQKALAKSAIPLLAYARRYEKYLELANMDVNVYVKKYETVYNASLAAAAKAAEGAAAGGGGGAGASGEAQAVAKTPADIKADIEALLAEKDVLEAVVPSSIVIGAFLVNTEGVRQALSKKKKAQAAALLDYLAKVCKLLLKYKYCIIRASHNV